MDALERLTARQEIADVIARYAIAYDDHDWEAFGELWTTDAAFVVNGAAFEGLPVMLRFLTTCLPDDYYGKHICAPSLIELGPDGTTATAQTDVLWIAQNFENSIIGRYDDTFVKRDGRWLFARREETSIPHRGGPPPYSETVVAVSGANMRA
jgi:uncharacterized protein (TIGR02246 family)